MEGSSVKGEESTVTFYFYHPCSFLQNVFRTLFRCLGFETGTNMCSSQAKEEETSLSKPHPSCACPVVTSENYSPSSSKKSSQEEDADPPSTTTTTQTLNASSMHRGDHRRRSGSSEGSPPQHN